MAKAICAISNITIEVREFADLQIAGRVGYIHPIFAADAKQLYRYFRKFQRNELSNKETYLLFLAYMHITGKVDWQTCVTLDWTCQEEIATLAMYLPKLVKVITLSAEVRHPSFSQPTLVVNYNNCSLGSIKGYIDTWMDNLNDLANHKIYQDEHARIVKLNNILTNLKITAPNSSKFAAIVARWAAVVGKFPNYCTNEWQQAIVDCLNPNKALRVNSKLLIEIQEYCQEHIDYDSLHYSTLMDAIKEGINNQISILGELDGVEVQISSSMSESALLQAKELQAASQATTTKLKETIVAKAPDKKPVPEDYPTKIAYIKAKLAWNVKENNK